MSIVRQDFRSKLSGEKGESMNTVLEKIKKMGIVPVVVIENEKDAVGNPLKVKEKLLYSFRLGKVIPV